MRSSALRRRSRQRSAIYDGLPRLLCPHVLGRKSGRLRVLFYQFGGSSNSGLPARKGRRRLALSRRGETQSGRVECERHGIPRNIAPGGRPAWMKSISMPTISLNEDPQQGQCGSCRSNRRARIIRQRRDRVRIMPLGAYAAIRGGGSPVLARGQRIQDYRRGQRGKNGSARPPGTHKLRCIAWRDGGTRASCGLQSAPAPTLVSVPRSPVR